MVIYEDAYIRGRQPGEITALISAGIRAGMRADRPTTIESGGTWCEAAALVLDAARPGDLVLLQPDTVEQTIPWLAERYGMRVRETQFDAIAGLVAHDSADRVPAASEPVEVRPGRLGRSVVAVRDIAAGETVLKGWGPQLPKRTRHSMQVDADTHILPDGVMVLVNHACEPNCGVLTRPAAIGLSARTSISRAAGEEITFDHVLKRVVVEGDLLAADVKIRYGEYIAEYLRALEAEATVPVGA